MELPLLKKPRRFLLLFVFVPSFVGAITDTWLGVPPEGDGRRAAAAARAAGEYDRAGWIAFIHAGDEAAARADFARALAADPADTEALEGAAWLDFAQGRMAAALEARLRYLGAYPGGDGAPALVSTIRLFDGVVPSFREAVPLMRGLAADPGADPAAALAAGRVARQLLMQTGRWDDAQAWADAQGYIKEFALAGVYGRYGLADLDTPFEPDGALPARPAVTIGDRAWRLHKTAFGRADVWGATGAVYGAAYAAAAFDLPAGEYYLEISGDDWYRARMGKTELVVRHPRDGAGATVARARFRAAGGRQLLVIKTVPNFGSEFNTDGAWTFQARILRAADLKPVIVNAAAADIAAAGPGEDVVRVEEPAPAVAAGAIASFYAGMDRVANGDYPGAIANLDAAVEAAPDCALFYVVGAYIRMLAGGEYYMAEAKARLRRARAEDPACVLAVEELAVFASFEGKRDEAVDYYRESLKIEPTYVSSLAGLAEIAYRNDWRPELARRARAALDLNADTHRAWKLLADYHYDQDDTPRAVEAYRRYLELKAEDVDARLKLAECLVLLGRMDEARAEYDAIVIVDPYRQEGYLGRADIAVRRGDEAAAFAAFEAGAAAMPRNAEILEQWGYYLVARGKGDEGYARLKEALALDGSNFRLRLYLTRAGVIAADDVDRALAFDPAALLADPIVPEDYPHADTLMLWDQTGTFLDDDFTFREQNRNLIHLFNDKGRERWGEITILSEDGTELLAARTHLPAGGAVDAVSVKESGGYKVVSMEQVVAGATLEIAYDLNLGRRMIYNLGEYYSQPFFMAEEEGALGRTRFALVTADDFAAGDRLRFETANGAPKPRKIRGRGRTAWLFERRDVPAVVAEPMMPSKDGYAPYVRATTFRDVDTLARWYQGELWGVFRADDILRDLAPARAPGEDDRALAARVYYYVVKNVEGSGGSVFYPSSARLTAFRGRGRTVDRAVLIVALCRVLGLDARIALVGAGGTKKEWDFITPDIFDTVLVYFPTLGEGGTFADPLLDTLAFGEVWTSTYGKPALVVDDRGYEIKRVPVVPFEKDAIALDMSLVLAADGAAEFEGRRSYRGLRGAYRDNFRNPEDRDGNVEITLSSLFAGATVDAYDLENLDDLEGEFALVFQGTVPGYARGRGKNLALKAVPYQLNLAQTYIASEKRRYPLRIERPEAWIDEVRIALPEGWRPEVKGGTERLRGPASHYSLTYEVADGRLTIKRALFVDQGDISPRDYGAFVKFCRDVDKMEKRELMLTPAGEGR